MNETSPAAAAEAQLVCQCCSYAVDISWLPARMFLKDVVQWNSSGNPCSMAEGLLFSWCEGLLVPQMVKAFRNLTL